MRKVFRAAVAVVCVSGVCTGAAALATTAGAAGGTPAGYTVTGTQTVNGSVVTTMSNGADEMKIIAPAGAAITPPASSTVTSSAAHVSPADVCPRTTNPVTCPTPTPTPTPTETTVEGSVDVAGDKTDPGTPTMTAVQAATLVGATNPQEFADLDTVDAATTGPSTAGATDTTTGATYGAPAQAGTTGVDTTQAPAANASPAAKGVTPNSSVTESQLYGNPICYAVHLDSGHAYIQGCSARYKVHAVGADWYFIDKYHASAKLHDSAIIRADRLSGIGLHDAWSAHNAIYEWAPASHQSVGSCRTITEQVSVFGVGGSESHQVCPNKIDPDWLSPTSYGSHWSGSAGDNQYEEAHGTAAIHSPANAAPSYGVYYKIWWT